MSTMRDRLAGRVIRSGLALALATLAAACSYPVRNQELTRLSPLEGYRWNTLAGGQLEDTLLIVTASGGGTRATALALATLRGLDRLTLAPGRSLADEVDLVSSVSGGSVTAAWFGLKGPQGLEALERDFVRQDGIAAIAASGLNPIGLAELATPSRERIDLLIDYLDARLFKDATYADLRARGKRPYVILNAADMAEGVPFSFTQDSFDLLCSDLEPLKLSVATAASAAFPIALSPVTLKNYSPCATQRRAGEWPPTWVAAAADSNWYDAPERVRRGRVARAYALGADVPPPEGRRYLHLLDGGIADNLGLAEPIRLLSSQDISPSFFNQIGRGTIRRIVVVMVNARSATVSALNTEPNTPGIVDMFGATINASIDNATFGTAERLELLLRERFEAAAARMPPPLAANFRAVQTLFVPVEFEAIDDESCRRRFQSIATSWTLPPGQVDALLLAGQALLRAAPTMARAAEALGATGLDALPTVDAACDVLAAAEPT